MKKTTIMLLIVFVALIVGCSDDCESQNPTVKLTNNGTDNADIQIKTSGGNTENINGVEPGTTSEKRSFAPGKIEFTISIKGEPEPIVYELVTVYCHDYTVKINEDNSVSSVGINLEKEAIL